MKKRAVRSGSAVLRTSAALSHPSAPVWGPRAANLLLDFRPGGNHPFSGPASSLKLLGRVTPCSGMASGAGPLHLLVLLSDWPARTEELNRWRKTLKRIGSQLETGRDCFSRKVFPRTLVVRQLAE